MKAIIHKLRANKNVLSLAGNAASAVFGLLTFSLLARSFNSEVFGEWVIYITSATFIEMFRFGLTRTALVRFLSGAEGEERKRLVGSNYTVGLVLTGLIVAVMYLVLLVFYRPIVESPYRLFFIWYPLLAVLNLPFNNALTIMQAEEKFGEIFMVRIINLSLFTVLLAMNFFLRWELPLLTVIIWHLAFNFLTSFVTIVRKWDGLTEIMYTSRETLRTLLNFGKYTTVTLIGSNLLRSADTFIISLSPMGSAAVAIYAIPLKLTEMLQIPLRSFAATAYPRMSKASILNETGKIKYYFYSYSGAMTLLFLPIIILGYVFAGFFILVLGGEQYLQPDLMPGESTVLIFRIFVIYGLMLPLDRMTGVALDAINRPQKNFYKILIMVAANIIGDLIAVFVFKSLAMVAVATLVFTFIGMVVGYIYVDREIGLDAKKVMSVGIETLTGYFRKKNE